MLPKILATKNPAEFRSRQVNVRQDAYGTHITPFGEEQNFAGMQSLRKKIESETIRNNLNGKGHDFANMGVSSILTITYDNDNYLMLVRQDRPDFGDSVAKLISGYIPADLLENPIKALEMEISEEFLPCTREGKVIRGLRKESFLPKPFENIVPYDQEVAFQMIESDMYSLPGMPKQKMHVGGKVINEGNPTIYYHAPMNCAQLVFNYHVNIPSLPKLRGDINHAEINYLKHSNATLNHSEDKFNPANKSLEVTLQDQGIMLIKLDGDRLTKDVFTYENGSLKRFDAKVNLSEAFAKKEYGIANSNNLLLEDYLR